MDAGLVNELRDKVRPAVEQLIALAADRGLSMVEIRQDGLEIRVERPAAAPLAVADDHHEVAPAPEEHHHMTPVLSTLVGTFKTRLTPGKPAAAAVGTQVEQGRVLGYIESMGLTYEIHAPGDGRLAEILVEEGHPVEYGQPLMVLEVGQ